MISFSHHVGRHYSQVNTLFHFADVPEEQLSLTEHVKEEQISYEDVMGCSDEEDIDSTYYSSEYVLENWRECKETTSKSKENFRQGLLFPYLYFTVPLTPGIVTPDGIIPLLFSEFFQSQSFLHALCL